MEYIIAFLISTILFLIYLLINMKKLNDINYSNYQNCLRCLSEFDSDLKNYLERKEEKK